MAISMAYLPALLHARGVGTAAFAAAQGSTFFPAMLGGILLAGWLAPCLVLSGVAKGLWGIALIGRQQELCPAGDARFPALLVGLGAVGAMATAAVMRVGVPLLESHVALVAWSLMAIAASLRALALLVLSVAGRATARLAHG